MRLVAAAADGDPAARQALFERYRDVAFRVAVRVTRRRADALDVVQDAFIRAFDKLDTFQRDAAFKTWLLRIVTNRALDLLRSRKVRRAVSLDGGGSENNESRLDVEDRDAAAVDDDLQRGELQSRLEAAIASLPEEQRTVFSLFAIDELTYAQIAETLGIPIGTVMSRIYHARRKLHLKLADLAPADHGTEPE